MTPCALFAVDLSEHVVQQYVCRSRGVRAGVVSDDAVKAVHSLYRSALKPTIEIIASGGRKQGEEFPPHVHVELSQSSTQPRGAYQLRQGGAPVAFNNVRGGLEYEVPEKISNEIQALAIGAQALRVF